MLKKILFRNSTNLQFIFATLGAIIGMTALLLSLQLIMDVQSFHSNEEELFGPNSVVIQKKVTKFTSIGMNSTEFTPEEISALEKKDFITDVAPFQSADFKVGISEVAGDGLPHFYADMFFQAIPTRFMDIDVNWDWTSESEYIPIVLPRDFIMIINYGFAQSQGMNQISEELLMAARLTIHIEGNGKKEKMIGRVVGFSHKISSILVPEPFLTHANNLYGNGRIQNPSRVFITTKDNSYGELDELMNDMNLDVNKSAIDVAKIKTIIAIVIGIFGIASVIIMLLSLLGFVQYSQLVLSKASYEIKTLVRIGYAIQRIVNTFIRQLSITFGLITAGSVAIMLTIKLLLVNPWLKENGIAIAGSSLWITLIAALICFLLFIASNYINIKKAVNRLGSE
ncbi:hypothetical protein [Crocinitomix algicola]|uniref:hypothetical protein n=1 Tax=Crocinitomix algicola TaxID=1740263 RepID=UPI000835D5DB|nr:hypothetical protein [Crocinitomix algicola]